jgi:alkylated DNA repair dioxygenase AlkB
MDYGAHVDPEPHDGREPLQRDGFTYLPRFMSASEGQELIAYFESLAPIWEQRHGGDTAVREGVGSRRIARPVYWLGAWQFASLGYYAEPHYREDRCVRAEPFPPLFNELLERLRPELARHDSLDVGARQHNTCLINYYGSEHGEGAPRDQARLRIHRDGEPGPVAMFCVGQPGLLEFVDPERSREPELALWTRHRSVVIISGADYKDRLYHRLTRVRYGAEPELQSPLADFALRRVSVSFRHVPEALISDFAELPAPARERVRPYVEQLARGSEHFAGQLAQAPPPPQSTPRSPRR